MIPQQTSDIFFAALTCWREARGETYETKKGVIAVIVNRAAAHWISDNCCQDVCVHPWQFSGMTAPGDPNLHKWPESKDPAWKQCLEIAEKAIAGIWEDPTFGATFYHDVSIGLPSTWGPVVETFRTGRIIFYRGV